MNATTCAVKILCVVLLGVITFGATGCATRALEKSSRSKALLSGMEPIAGEEDWVRDPANGGAHKVSAMAADEHPILYRVAQVVDYGILPAAGIYGLYQAAEAIDGGGDRSDSRRVYNFYGDGDVTVQDASPSASSDQSNRPTTTTTTSSGSAP